VVSWAAEERVLEALARGESRASACRAGPMSTKTLSRRLQDRDFVARFEVKCAVVSTVIDQGLSALAGKSMRTAAHLLDLHHEPQIQARVSLGILSLWRQTRGSELAARLAELEELGREQTQRWEQIRELLANSQMLELEWNPSPDDGTGS